MDEKIKVLIRNLKKNNMRGVYVKNTPELIEKISELIPEGHKVGCGDSVTLEQTGVFEFLRNGNYIFYDKHQPGLRPEEKRALYLQNFSADTFVTGTNGVTLDGTLFNIDGNGSRVAPMLYGPSQVIVVVGVNKITETMADAMERARTVAAPLDAIRLGKDTPCTKLHTCVDCQHEQRICNDFVWITGQFDRNRIKVIIVGETLGY